MACREQQIEPYWGQAEGDAGRGVWGCWLHQGLSEVGCEYRGVGVGVVVG